LLKCGASTAVAAGLGSPPASRIARAQEEIKFKLGTDLPPAHPVNVRLREAIHAINSQTNGPMTISLFPNNRLGGDSDMLSQLQPGALELATFSSTVLSTIIPAAAITGVERNIPGKRRWPWSKDIRRSMLAPAMDMGAESLFYSVSVRVFCSTILRLTRSAAASSCLIRITSVMKSDSWSSTRMFVWR
jgi:Bacterial extracellular solute-binding protein, family 7